MTALDTPNRNLDTTPLWTPPATGNGVSGEVVSTYERLRLAALDAIAAGQIDARNVDAVEVLIAGLVGDYQARSDQGLSRPLANATETIDRLVRSLTGAGPLQKFFENPELADEVTMKGDTITFTSRDGRQVVDHEPTCEAELTAIALRLLADSGVTVDRENPVVVHQVWNNRVRASVSIPPVADRLDATFRIYRHSRISLNDLVDWDSLNPAAASLLAACTLTPTGLLFTGGPGSGKSTVLNAVLWRTPSTVNTRIIQGARELDAPHLPGGRWSPESGGHSNRTLTQRAMQFNPQELVIGETLGEEAFELLKAANAGCGFMTTLHANSAQLGMQSLVTAALMAGENVPERVVRASFARLINLVVHCEAEPLHRIPPGQRRRRQVMEICVVPPQINGDEFVLEPLFSRDDFGQPLEFCGHRLPDDFERRLNRALPDGVTVRDICEGRTALI